MLGLDKITGLLGLLLKSVGFFSLFLFSLRFDGCMHIWVLHAPYMKGVGFINSGGFPQGRPMFLLVFFSKIVILKST